MKLIWFNRNSAIYCRLNLHDRINFKALAGVSLRILMFQHPDVLINRIKRVIN